MHNISHMYTRANETPRQNRGNNNNKIQQHSLFTQNVSRPHWPQRAGDASPHWQPPLTQHAQLRSAGSAIGRHEHGQPVAWRVHRSTWPGGEEGEGLFCKLPQHSDIIWKPFKLNATASSVRKSATYIFWQTHATYTIYDIQIKVCLSALMTAVIVWTVTRFVCDACP